MHQTTSVSVQKAIDSTTTPFQQQISSVTIQVPIEVYIQLEIFSFNQSNLHDSLKRGVSGQLVLVPWRRESSLGIWEQKAFYLSLPRGAGGYFAAFTPHVFSFFSGDQRGN
jgi:hypothetical protein